MESCIDDNRRVVVIFLSFLNCLRLHLDVDIKLLELNWVVIPNQSSIENEL